MITTRLYLDTRSRTDQEAPARLKLAIYWNRVEALLFTGFTLAPSQWDAKKREAKDKNTQLSIARFKYKVDNIIADMQDAGKCDGLTATDIRNAVVHILTPSAKSKARFMDCLEKFASTRPQPRTREIYRATADRIRAFDRMASFLTFEDITIGWLDRFDSFLAKTSPKKNARNIHLRNIRAVFNYALREDPALCYPFRKYEIRPEPTMKRSLSAEQLRILFNADLPEWQHKYVDFFKISFMLIGMNTEDLVNAVGIVNGRLEYSRAKTHRPYSIKVEPECMALIEKYKGVDHLLDVLDHYASTHYWTSKVDQKLKTITATLNLPPISMYWARHSWATIGAELDIPKETLAAAMGHSASTVTDIYINFDRSKIDRANRKVLDYVLYNKKEQDLFELLRSLNEKMAKMA